KAKFEELPPGHNYLKRLSLLGFRENECSKLKLFYVGGMSSHYQMHKLFKVVRRVPKVILTLCTREVEWLSVKHEYPELGDNITVVHKSGSEMEALLLDSDVALLFVEPHEYWEFASPFKLYEYIGFEKPILASENTLAGEFVSEKKVGWALDYFDEYKLE